MASLNTATNRVMTSGFITQVTLIAVGTAFSSTATGWIRDNVVDLELAGADALYGFAAALALAFSSTVGVPWKFAKPLSMGLAAGGVMSELQAQNIV